MKKGKQAKAIKLQQDKMQNRGRF